MDELVIRTSPEALERLTTSLDRFRTIHSELEPLEGTGPYITVTDGTYVVFVDAQGYDYP